MSLYAVIMAGGVGSRFWPRSRRAHPKQFLDVFGDASLIQNTFARLQPLVEAENVFVVTNEAYAQKTHEHLPAVPEANILGEPTARNTAPCIALAAARLHALDPDATMIVLPADHLIANVERFHDVLRAAVDAAQTPGDGSGPLVTIGIRPTHPETGYGYVQYDVSDDPDGQPDGLDGEAPRAYPVLSFAEKPDVATAERFLDAGDFLWNSGMFIWRADAILAALETHLPNVHAAFAPLEDAFRAAPQAPDAIAQAYERTPKISIDYGVMERASNVLVVPGSFGWNDVGDWRAVHDLADKDDAGNRAEGNVILQDTVRSFARSADGRLLVLVGMEDAVVVDTGDAVLVCHREQAQKVKNVVDFLGLHGMEDYT